MRATLGAAARDDVRLGTGVDGRVPRRRGQGSDLRQHADGEGGKLHYCR